MTAFLPDAGWLLRLLLVGGGILLAGRIGLMLVRQPAQRAAVATASVMAALAVVPLSLLPAWLPVAAPPHAVTATAGVPVFEPAEEAVAWVPPRTDLLSRDEPAKTPATISAPLISAPLEVRLPAEKTAAFDPAWLVGLYVVLVFGFLGRLVVGHVGLARLWRTATLPPEWVASLAGSSARVRLHPRVAGPVCFGVLRPRILLPAALVESADRLAVTAAVAHELAHLDRRDPLTGWTVGLCRSLFFVCPWLPGLCSRLRLAQEQLADARAADAVGGPAEYADVLMRLSRTRLAPLGSMAARGTDSELSRRITMLLRSDVPVQPRCPRRWRLAVASAFLASAAAATGMYVPSATAEEPEKKAPAKAVDPIRETLEKLKKDVEGNPAAAKQLEELLKQFEGPAKDPAVVAPPPPPPPPAARLTPIPLLEGDDIAVLQAEMRKQMEEAMARLQGQLGARNGNLLVPGGMGGGRLGIRVEKPSDVLASQLDLPNGQGLVCVDVPVGSAAGKAGLKPNDILLEVAGKPVPNETNEFVQNLRGVKADEAVDIVLLRKGKKETIKGVKLPEAMVPPPPPLALTPVFAPPPPPRFDPMGPAVNVQAGPGESFRVEKVNEAFTVFYTKEGVKLTLTGTKEEGQPAKAESIEVEENGKTTKAESVDKLPAAYREIAEKALKAIK